MRLCETYKKNLNDASYLMESYSSTTMTPHGLIRALHTEFFQRNKICAHVKSDILQNFQIQKLYRSNRLFFRWCVSLRIFLYGVWFIALMKRHFMKNGIFLFWICVWIFSGPLIRTQFRFFSSLFSMPIIIMHVKKENHMEHSIHILDWILTS